VPVELLLVDVLLVEVRVKLAVWLLALRLRAKCRMRRRVRWLSLNFCVDFGLLAFSG